MDERKMFYTLGETAEVFGVSLSTINRWVGAGRLDVHRFGGCTRVSAESIRQFANSSSKKVDK